MVNLISKVFCSSLVNQLPVKLRSESWWVHGCWSFDFFQHKIDTMETVIFLLCDKVRLDDRVLGKERCDSVSVRSKSLHFQNSGWWSGDVLWDMVCVSRIQRTDIYKPHIPLWAVQLRWQPGILVILSKLPVLVPNCTAKRVIGLISDEGESPVLEQGNREGNHESSIREIRTLFWCQGQIHRRARARFSFLLRFWRVVWNPQNQVNQGQDLAEYF